MIDTGCPPPKPPAIIVRQATPNPAVQRPVFRVQTQARPVKPRPRLRTTGCSLPATMPGLPMLAPGLLTAEVPPLLEAFPGRGMALAAPDEPLAFDAPGAGPERATFAASSQWQGGSALFLPERIQPWAGVPVPGIPEPGTWALLLAGLGVVALKVRKC